MKKLTIVFTTNHADTLGNACRLDMVCYLTKYFKATIVTNCPEFISGRFPGVEIISFNYDCRVPIIRGYILKKKLAQEINKVASDGVFLFHEDSLSAIWVKYVVFQYIHQYGKRGKKTPESIKEHFKKIITNFNHHLSLKGFRKSKINFVVSNFLIDLFKKQGLNNMVHIPHAIEIEKFQNPLFSVEHEKLKELKNSGYFVISYTGWVTEHRGFQLMMDTIKDLVSEGKNFVLVIAGADSVFSQRILDYQKRNNLDDNILNFGIIDVSLIPGILYYSNVCLSFWDTDVPGFQLAPPQKLFEYFAAGKPIVCNKIQTHDIFVENGKTGFVLDMDYHQVSKSIRFLKDNKEIYNTMCNNALKEAFKYDIDLVYGKMVDKIKIILDETERHI